MLTYVINTSENKTFDSDRLFDLAGYNKIRWMNCRLDRIRECADAIYARQNVLGADQFRIAVIVDFFGYDRIRVPYGRNGYGEEEGVDLSLYTPYIEIFINDNLITPLEYNEMFSKDYEVYYVQNAKYERYEFLDNAKEQLRRIMAGDESSSEQSIEMRPAGKDDTAPEAEPSYGIFRLYCTENVTLPFYLSSYPYGAEGKMTFDEFFDAFRARVSNRSKLRRHFYITSYGAGPVRAAFDTLSLSLHLIRVYEREENVGDDVNLEIVHIDADTLKEVLETSWMKIALARELAADNRARYFSLEQNEAEIREDLEDVEALGEEGSIQRIKFYLKTEEGKRDLSADTMYWDIVKHDEKDEETLQQEMKQEFDQVFSAYLKKRDETNERCVEKEFEDLRRMGGLAMTDQCPSGEQYRHVIEEKKKTVSDLFERALAAEYIAVDYSEERERAEKAYHAYNKWRACMHKNLIGDLIFLILTVLIMTIPYHSLQIGRVELLSVSGLTLYLTAAGIFAGLFLISFGIVTMTMLWRMRKEKKKIEEAHLDCVAKRKYSFSALKRRYEKDLIRIEQARYEIRQITHLYEENLKKESRATYHRVMLEELQDKLSSMLNNLGVEPVYNDDQNLSGEFDLNRSVYSKDNRIYQVFSIETIEKLFSKKG